MHDLVKDDLDKFKERIRKVENYLRDQADTQISYSSDQIKTLVESGHIPKELGVWWLKRNNEMCKEHHERQEFIKNNPDLSSEEISKLFFKEGVLSPEETAKRYEEAAMNGEFYICLIENRHLLIKEIVSHNKSTQSLFENLDSDENFGIVNCISNSLYHLEELLKNIVLNNLHDNFYEAKGSMKNSQGEAISLSYSFQSTSKEEAEKILVEYKTTMKTKGLKVWLSYWLMANKRGRFEYTCPLIEVMKLIADEDRESFFSVKEKEEYWALTKMLEMTKLSRERKIKKRGTGTEVIQWIEQPLVEILGGEKEMTEEDKYPTAVSLRVLAPKMDMDKKGFAPHIYNNNTLLLSPSDVFLAFKLQSRASQRKKGNCDIHVDWDFIFEAGNLEKTAISNQRGAKAKARKKMDRLQENKIIEKWDEELMGVCVTPNKQKQKEKPINKEKTT